MTPGGGAGGRDEANAGSLMLAGISGTEMLLWPLKNVPFRYAGSNLLCEDASWTKITAKSI